MAQKCKLCKEREMIPYSSKVFNKLEGVAPISRVCGEDNCCFLRWESKSVPRCMSAVLIIDVLLAR